MILVGEEYIDFIAKEIKQNNYVDIVELGTRTGKCALRLKKLCPKINLTTYDVIEDFNTKEFLRANKINYVVANTRTVKHKHKKIDLLFCDTLHTAKQLIEEYNNFCDALHEKSMVIVDDVFLNDKGKAFVLIGDRNFVIGKPTRQSGLGVAYSDKWHKINYVVGESIPPIVANMWEIYNRLRYKSKL